MLQAIDLRIERRFLAPIETVWTCLTRADLIARWFFAVDFKPVVGHRFRIEGPTAPGWRGWTNVEILALEPPTRMVWWFDCVDEAPASRVEFLLEDLQDYVRLRLIHDGDAPAATRRLLDDGWNSYATRLVALVEETRR